MWLDFSSNGIHRELEMRGRRRWAQISHFGKLGGGSCEKTRRRRGKGKTPGRGSSHAAGTNGEEGDGLAICKRVGVGPTNTQTCRD